eukprot:6212578-Pleurochrysis_carterae.AAC.2
METNRVGAARGSRAGWGRGVATAKSGVQMCERRNCQHQRSCLLMNGVGQTRAVGFGSPRK